MLWKCADVPRTSPTLHTCAEGDHLFQWKFTSQWTVLYRQQGFRKCIHRVRAKRVNRVLSAALKGIWKCSGSTQMYHEILPPCTHAQKEITSSNASLHPNEQFYMHKNTSASVFIVWVLQELTEYCQLLKKGSASALEVRRCTTKFSHLPHMRRRRSPVPMQVYIPVNSSICIRTLPQVYSSCES